MTKQKWRSAFVAGVFAVHPLHVESVAWIAERKDVLSAFFQMLTLLLYVRYAKKPQPRRYAVMALAFALSLLAKPMAVTLPFVLLLLDYWPLHRMESGPGQQLLIEKLPLLAMSIAASVLTFFAQRTTAIVTLARLPLAERLANAVFAYLAYIGKAFWPTGLAVLYPIQKPPSLGVFAAMLIVSAVTIAAVLGIRQRHYSFVGWFWYLGMLVPVIGLVQVGFQSMADRYTYVPFVGLSIALVWTLGEICDSKPTLQRAAIANGMLVLVALSAGAHLQAKYWRTSVTLYQHALAVTKGNYVIQNNLGVIFETEGQEEEAIDLFRQAIAAAPDYPQALNNLGAILGQRGKNPDEAIELLRRAVAADPGYAAARSNLGHTLLQSGQLDESFAQLSQALRLSPDAARIHADLGVLASLKGNLEESRQQLQEAVRLEPNDADVQSNLCIILLRLNHPDQALIACNAALKINPNHPGARAALANLRRTRHP